MQSLRYWLKLGNLFLVRICKKITWFISFSSRKKVPKETYRLGNVSKSELLGTTEQAFYMLDAFPVAQPTVSKHLNGKATHTGFDKDGHKPWRPQNMTMIDGHSNDVRRECKLGS